MKKRCKRKVWACANPVQHAIDGAAITPDYLLNSLRSRELAAIEALRTGAGTLQEWSDMAALLNVCEEMARGGIGPEALEACERAEAALIEAGKRYETMRRMVITGAGLQALRDLYQYHDLQRQSVSRGTYEKWIAKTSKRVKSKAPGVRDMSEI